MPITSTAVLLIGVSSILAADVNLPFDSRTAEQKEESCWKIRYRKCDGIERSEDLVFVFPSNQFKRNRALVTKLQTSWNLLRRMTGVDPVKAFGQRVVIGFRHPKDEGGFDCEPGWLWENGWIHGFDNEQWPCINLPWRYLNKKDQPEECLAHELGHPFLSAKKIRHSEPLWVEGMSNLLSLPVFEPMGLHEVGLRRFQFYRSAAWSQWAYRHQDYAGRLIRWCQRKNVDPRRSEELKKVLPQLWDMDLGTVLAQPPKKLRSAGAPR